MVKSQRLLSCKEHMENFGNKIRVLRRLSGCHPLRRKKTLIIIVGDGVRYLNTLYVAKQKPIKQTRNNNTIISIDPNYKGKTWENKKVSRKQIKWMGCKAEKVDLDTIIGKEYKNILIIAERAHTDMGHFFHRVKLCTKKKQLKVQIFGIVSPCHNPGLKTSQIKSKKWINNHITQYTW